MFGGEQIVDRLLASDVQHFKDARQVAVEAFIPKGARAMYGLLGAEFIPLTGDEIQVIVNTSTQPFELWKEALIPTYLDDVRVGLTPSYANKVIEGVIMAGHELHAFPSGKLHFQCAAHGVLSSCEAIFKTLGRIVVRLVTVDRLPSSEDEILPFLDFRM